MGHMANRQPTTDCSWLRVAELNQFNYKRLTGQRGRKLILTGDLGLALIEIPHELDLNPITQCNRERELD